MALRASLIKDDSKIPAEAVFRFPGGLKDYLVADIEGQDLVVDQVFAGRVEKSGSQGSLEWAIAWLAGERRICSFLLQHHPDARRGNP